MSPEWLFTLANFTALAGWAVLAAGIVLNNALLRADQLHQHARPLAVALAGPARRSDTGPRLLGGAPPVAAEGQRREARSKPSEGGSDAD